MNNRAYADLAARMRAAGLRARSGIGKLDIIGPDDAEWIADQLDRLAVLCKTSPIDGYGDCLFCGSTWAGVFGKHEGDCAWLLAKQAFEVER